MTDPADCGPVTLAFCQDVQAEAFDWPAEFFAPKEWHRRRPAPAPREVKVAADAIRARQGGRSSSPAAACSTPRPTDALEGLRREAQHPRRRDPGRQVVDALGPPAEPRLDRRHRLRRHQRRRRGGRRVVGVGTRLQDFTTGSWALFQQPGPPHRLDQRHPLRRPQAQRPAAGRRREGWRSRSSPPPLGDTRFPPPTPARSRPTGPPPSTRSPPRREGRQRAAHRHAGDRRGAAQRRRGRHRRLRRRRPAGRAAQALAGGARAATTSNTASRPWATRSPAASASRWRTRTARSW